MKSLQDLLKKKKELRPNPVSDQDTFQVFRKVIKEEYGNFGIEKFKPDYYKDKTIFIKCFSSAWAGELFQSEKKIVELMNRDLGEGAIERIKVK